MAVTLGALDVTTTPEPASVVLVATGFLGVIGTVRRKSRPCSA